MSRFGYDVKSEGRRVRNNHRLDWDFMSFLTLFFCRTCLTFPPSFGIHPHTLLIHVANVYREK